MTEQVMLVRLQRTSMSAECPDPDGHSLERNWPNSAQVGGSCSPSGAAGRAYEGRPGSQGWPGRLPPARGVIACSIRRGDQQMEAPGLMPARTPSQTSPGGG